MQLTHRIKLLFALLYLLCASAVAETLKDTAAARALTNQVMAKVGNGDLAGGVEVVRSFLIVPRAEFDVMIEQIKLQQPAMAQRFGRSIGHEFIREDKVGENLLRIVHIQRFEKHAMRWTFYFYRGNDGWVLNTFKSDDDIQLLFPS
ncbi:hypothetical protein [Massilia sp.]|uniref:hypothetical protein n=1 Tax=Massilia sp. TaxID=1882437 RepID=UPI0028A8D9E7|nr:hypothetical protein [Massilia sp.]